ncbi:MAG: hypothetical protein ACREBC_36720, partial [Pyrinomonadaceae bacterium]
MNVFIVGAGFTKAIFPDAPLNRDLLRVLAVKPSASASAALRDRYKTGDIEIALTKLDVDVALSQEEELRKLRGRIESELADYFGSFCASEDLIAQSQWLANLVDDVFSSGDVAISLNYDCVLEGALDCRGKWSPNGGYGSSLDNPLASNDRTSKSPVLVLKIHGSANFIIAPYVDKPTATAVNFDFDERFFPRSAKNTHFGYGAGTGKGYVIAPSYVKIPKVEISYLMLDALTASTHAKNLIIIGSALRPEDGFLTVLVTNFLHQPTWRSRKIVVVDPEAESLSNRLKNYWGVNVANQILPISDLLETSVARLLAAIRN